MAGYTKEGYSNLGGNSGFLGWISNILEGFTGFITGVDKMDYDLRMTRETNEANLRAVGMQNATNIALWRMNNEYNDPSKQSQRLMNAGLSASAAAQSVSNVVPSQPVQSADMAVNVPPPPAQSTGNPLGAALSMVSGLRELIGAKRDLIAAKNEKTEMQFNVNTMLDRQDVVQWTAKQMQQDYEYQQSVLPYRRKTEYYGALAAKNAPRAAKLANKNAVINYRLAKQKFGWIDKLNDEQIKEIQQKIRNLKKQEDILEEQKKTQQAQTSYVQSQTDVNESQVGLNKALSAESGSRKALNEATTANVKESKAGIVSENRLKELDVILKEAGSPETVTQQIAAFVAAGAVSFDQVAESIPAIKKYIATFNASMMTDYERDLLLNVILEGTAASQSFTPWSKGYMRGTAVPRGSGMFNHTFKGVWNDLGDFFER